MVKRPTRLEDIPSTELAPEHIPLVRERIESLGRQRTRWIGILNSLEAESGVAPTVFADKSEAVVQPNVMLRPPRKNKRDNPTQPVKPIVFHEGSWGDTIHNILTEAGRPLSFAEVKEEILKTPLAETMKENAGRTYYSTVQRLKINGLVVDHNGGITTPTVLARFLADVAAGRVVDVQFARYRNKYTEAIYRFLNTKPKGASLAEIMLHLRTVEGFAMASGDYQKSYVLGLLRKLIYQSKSVVKLARGFYKLSAFDKADGSPSPNDDSADTESERPTEGDLLSVGRVH